MADFYYQTSISVRAPWLLDATQLQELDSIVAEQWVRLSEYRERKMQREVEEALPFEIERAFPKPEKKKEKEAVREALCARIAEQNQNYNRHLVVSIVLAGGKKLTTSSIREAIQHAAVSDSEVKKLSLTMKVSDIIADFEIDTRYNEISCRVSPEVLPESRETFSALRGWLAKHQPAKWQVRWGDLCFWLWMTWFAFSCFSAIAIVASLRPPSSFQPQAVEILREGVTATNQAKAIELILALQTGYSPTPVSSKFPKWWLPSVGIGLLACVLFSVKPESHIGVGREESTVRSWRKWIRTLSVILPGLIFSTFAWPALSDIVKSWFK